MQACSLITHHFKKKIISLPLTHTKCHHGIAIRISLNLGFKCAMKFTLKSVLIPKSHKFAVGIRWKMNNHVA